MDKYNRDYVTLEELVATYRKDCDSGECSVCPLHTVVTKCTVEFEALPKALITEKVTICDLLCIIRLNRIKRNPDGQMVTHQRTTIYT